MLSRHLIDQALDDAAKDAKRIATSLIMTPATPEDFASPSPSRVAVWQQRLSRVVGGTDVVRVKVWNARGQVVYSDNPALVGRAFPLEANEGLSKALQGHLAMDLSGIDKPENMTKRASGPLLEIYVPVVPPGSTQVAGAYEVYLTAASIKAKISAIRRLVWGGSAAAFGLLYASLFVLVSGASRRLARQQEVLRASEARFRELFENANDIVFTLDVAGNFTSMNRTGERLIGYARDKVCAMNLFQVVAPEDLESARLMLDKNVAERAPTTSTLEIVSQNGSRLTLEVSTRPVSQNGSPVRVQGIARDVTERKRTEEEIGRQRDALYQSEKLAAMSQLLASMAHELNNPLSVVAGQTFLLINAVGGGPLAERAAKIGDAAERCTRIVNNFLGLARRRPPERKEVDLNRVIQEAVELLAYELRVENVEVTLDLAEDLPSLWADPHQLHQVVVNLVTNAQHAMRHTSPPRRITLTSRFNPADRRVSLEAADTGPGIPPQIRSRIFEAFFTTKPAGQGTGLGLSLCQGIIEGHGGTIRVESPPGRGAVFQMELPVMTGLVREPEAHTAEAGPAIQGKTILVVDDDPEVARVLADLLALDGHRVDTAAHGAVALEQIQKQAYDVILSDHRMPVLDGPGFYRELERDHPEYLRRIVLITGDALNPETEAFSERAGLPTVAKPFVLGDVRRAIEQVLCADSAESRDFVGVSTARQ